MLYQLGGLQISVAPFNAHEVSSEVGADFATKDVIGVPRPREFTGEADEKHSLSGRLFPFRLGGLDELDTLEAMARSGEPQILVRGDGRNLGWHLIEKVKRKESYLAGNGVGRQIEVEIELVASPNPASPASMLSLLFSLFG